MRTNENFSPVEEHQVDLMALLLHAGAIKDAAKTDVVRWIAERDIAVVYQIALDYPGNADPATFAPIRTAYERFVALPTADQETAWRAVADTVRPLPA